MTVIIELYALKVNRSPGTAEPPYPLTEPPRNGKVMSAQVKRITPPELEDSAMIQVRSPRESFFVTTGP